MVKKLTIIDNKVIVFLDGVYFERENLSKEQIQTLVTSNDIDELLPIISEKYEETMNNYSQSIELTKKVNDSKLLTLKGDCIYMEGVSPLSLPETLVKAIISAEENNDEDKLTAYKNFWILMSLNPDERCRRNLFWFLQKYGMTISKSGFFVAYRNVDTTSEPNVFTDHHTHKFKIKIGEMVTMPRDKCDSVQENTCSNGLHVAGKGWLKRNYFGNTGLACLVNPTDVVAVPPYDNYGKLRTCAYLPMAVIKYDECNDVIPLDVEDGFDCSYVTKVIYEGIMSPESSSPYSIVIPNLPGINKESITDSLLDIALKCVTDKVL